MEFVLLFFSDLQKNFNIKTPPIKSFKLFKQKLTSEYVSYSFTDLQTYANIKKILTSVFGSKSSLFQETFSLRLSELRLRSIHGFYFSIKIAGGCLPFVQFVGTQRRVPSCYAIQASFRETSTYLIIFNLMQHFTGKMTGNLIRGKVLTNLIRHLLVQLTGYLFRLCYVSNISTFLQLDSLALATSIRYYTSLINS